LIREADALLALARPLSAQLISQLTRCRVIVRYGAGMDSVDLKEAQARDIVVASVPDASVQEVAAHSLALLMLCARKLWAFRRVETFAVGDPAPVHPLRRLSETTLGLIGFGRIAQALAQMSHGVFGRILAHDPLVTSWDQSLGVERSTSLEELLENADFVSLHVPLTENTQHLLGRSQLLRLKPGASIVNTARGALIDEAALVESLKSGHVAGAGLDVLQEEPPSPDHPLLSFPQVYYTPHLAWYSEASRIELRRRAAEEVLRVLTGKPALNPVVI
jgi:D-3-phosphoglycerate dehydrogenase